ncbi:MAGa3780 family membrane protein [Metamycoplasma hyosynoviae]|uniref:MAGa3780 family membrane protein n=1 Tax=Metamycoplasma hyosynoviae TaxID=29559 RepID=UPI003B432998
MNKKFLSLSKLHKAIFFVGIFMLILNISILIHYFKIYGIEKTIDQLKSSGADQLIGKGTKNNEFFPNAIAMMFSQLSTFTMISNMVLAISMIVYGLNPDKQKAQSFFFFAVVNITITFLIYWTLIFYFSLKNGTWNHLERAIPSFILHAINPAIGFILLGFARKSITLKTYQIWMTNIMVLSYFLYAFTMFFIADPIKELNPNLDKTVDVYTKYNIVVYKFLNFKQPLFYKGGKLGIVILLDIFMFIIGGFLTPGLAWFWKGVYRINILKLQPKETVQEIPQV